MLNSTCGSGASWCVRADDLFGVDGVHVLAVTGRDAELLTVDVETDQTVTGCPQCGVLAVGHGRRVQLLRGAPCFGRPVRVRWRKRIWRCPDQGCPRSTWTEAHPYAGPRSKLIARAVAWAVAGLRHDDTTVSAIARRLGVAWGTVMAAVTAAATDLLGAGDRLSGVKTIGVDEHIWLPSKTANVDKAVTVMVDLTRDEHGHVHARLLDVVTGRSGKAYADWLTSPGAEVRATVEHAALDPFRGYANAIDDELPDAVPVLDVFHVVKLASTALDEVRRRIQQDTLGRRGHAGDPLYRIRRTLMTGEEHADPRQRLGLSLIGREGGATVDTAYEGLPFAYAPERVNVNGQPALLALADDGAQYPNYWILAGQFADPTTPIFLLTASESLNREQVLQIAAAVSYTP